MVGRLKEFFGLLNKEDVDKEFLKIDRNQVLRTNNIQKIPSKEYRNGGKISYAEWAHVIGIFQTILYQQLVKMEGNKILDIGCGTGLLAISCQNFVNENGFYLGIDVMKENIEFCKNHYINTNLRFEHFDVKNAMYANNQKSKKMQWNVESDSIDMVTALSVWTHLNEQDALFYFKEISRVLKKEGNAIITFFYLDGIYKNSLMDRINKKGRYHETNQLNWIFDTKAYESDDWFYPKQLKVPENAIGISENGMQKLITHSGLKLKKYYSGNWKEKPGVYFQDILIFEKI
jgi:SAM-dependent methyltransferase